MNGRLQIRHGKNVPTIDNLIPFELGYSTDTKLIYIKIPIDDSGNYDIIPTNFSLTQFINGSSSTDVVPSAKAVYDFTTDNFLSLKGGTITGKLIISE